MAVQITSLPFELRLRIWQYYVYALRSRATILRLKQRFTLISLCKVWWGHTQRHDNTNCIRDFVPHFRLDCLCEGQIGDFFCTLCRLCCCRNCMIDHGIPAGSPVGWRSSVCACKPTLHGIQWNLC